MTLYRKQKGKYQKIYSEDAKTELSPRELLKRGKELADAVETMEEEENYESKNAGIYFGENEKGDQ